MKKLIFLILLLPLVSNASIFKNLKQLREGAYQKLNFESKQSDSVLCNDSIWNVFVNDAVLQTSVDADCIEAQKRITLTNNQYSKLVDTAISKFLWVIKAENRTMVPLKHWPVAFLEEKVGDTTNLPAGFPGAWWQNADSLNFFPPSVKTDTFLVGYSKKAKYLSSDTVTTDLPIKTREIALLYVCYLFKSRVGLLTDADWWYAKYAAAIQNWRTVNRREPYDIIQSPDTK